MLFHASQSFTVMHELNEADIVFLGVPFASCSLSKPAIYGPIMVREALKLTEDYIDGINIFEKLKIHDAGDLEIVPDFKITASRIKETLEEIREANPKAFPIIIGGDHSITLPITEALRPKTIIQLDAHADLRKDYLGCAFMQQTWGYHASRFAKLFQIGVRSWNQEEIVVRKENHVEFISLDDFKRMRPTFEKPIHLTIDVDVLDPAFVETGLPVAGGLTPKELFSILRELPAVQSMDIVEIADDRLPSKTGFLSAEMIKIMLSKLVKR